MQAPRLCGSVTPSSTSSSGGLPARGFERLLELGFRISGARHDLGHGALVALAVGEPIEVRILGFPDLHIAGLRELPQVRQARRIFA